MSGTTFNEAEWDRQFRLFCNALHLLDGGPARYPDTFEENPPLNALFNNPERKAVMRLRLQEEIMALIEEHPECAQTAGNWRPN
jgi:hypothetical protein